jgi:hypothetical protein
MKTKKFPDRWIDMVMRTVKGGKVCVNINGERSNFLKLSEALGRVTLFPLYYSTW